MTSTAWVPVLSALIGALAGLGGGLIAAYFQRLDRREAERARRREEAAKAVGPVYSLLLEGEFARSGLGLDDLTSRLESWKAAWSVSREPLLIMSAGHPSNSVHQLGLDVAASVREWLEAVQEHVTKARELAIHPDHADLERWHRDVTTLRQEAIDRLRRLLIAIRQET
jgi:hypothetical protein